MGLKLSIVRLCQKARVETLAKVAEERSLNIIPPYDDARIIAGQGTIGIELNQQVPGLDYVLVPIGGGGLVSGIAIAYQELSPKTKIIAVEPEAANDSYLSS